MAIAFDLQPFGGLSLLIVSFLFFQNGSAVGATDTDLALIKDTLEGQAKVLSRLTYDVTIQDDDWSQPPGEWADADTGAVVTVIIDANPGGRVFLDASSLRYKWEGGAHSRLEEHRTFAFDGSRSIDLLRSIGPAGAMKKVNQATISADVPAAFRKPRRLTGEEFFLNFMLVHHSTTLAPLLSHFVPSGAIKISVNPTKYLGQDQLEVVIQMTPSTLAIYTERLVLARERGFALLRRDTSKVLANNPGQTRETVYEVSKLIDLGNGIWLPAAASIAGKQGTIPSFRSRYEFTKYRVLESSDEDVFSVPLEPGSRVKDTRFDVNFIVGENINKTNEKIQGQLKAIMR